MQPLNKLSYRNTEVSKASTIELHENCIAYFIENKGTSTAIINGITLRPLGSLSMNPSLLPHSITWTLSIRFEGVGTQNLLLQEYYNTVQC